jgi:hypothetical protein
MKDWGYMLTNTLISGVEAATTNNQYVLAEYCKQGAMAHNIIMRRDLAMWKDGKQLVTTYLWHNNEAQRETLARAAVLLDDWLNEKREELLELVAAVGNIYLQKNLVLYSREDVLEEQETWEKSHRLKRFNFKESPFWFLMTDPMSEVPRLPVAIFDADDLGDFFKHQL